MVAQRNKIVRNSAYMGDLHGNSGCLGDSPCESDKPGLIAQCSTILTKLECLEERVEKINDALQSAEGDTSLSGAEVKVQSRNAAAKLEKSIDILSKINNRLDTIETYLGII